MVVTNLLGRLRKAVHKVKLILQFNVQGWRLIASVVAPSTRHRLINLNERTRRYSFNDRPGLRAYTSDGDSDDSGSTRTRQLQRTTSYLSEDDIDKRAEMFIANFHRQLQIERQISLELQYCRGNSLTSP